MNILIIEDEQEIAAFVKKGLEENGHEVTVSYDGEMGLKLAMMNAYDLILLDIIIPKINGLDVCKKLREELKFTNPIIMLTALGATNDVVIGLDNGADDYLSKPFKFQELLARINALKRRGAYVNNTRVMTISDLKVDLDKKEVMRANKKIQLTAKEFHLLVYLLENKNRVVSRVDILENVWEVNFDFGTNVIDVYINYLRNKIDKGFDSNLIHTVVGMGYVLKET